MVCFLCRPLLSVRSSVNIFIDKSKRTRRRLSLVLLVVVDNTPTPLHCCLRFEGGVLFEGFGCRRLLNGRFQESSSGFEPCGRALAHVNMIMVGHGWCLLSQTQVTDCSKTTLKDSACLLFNERHHSVNSYRYDSLNARCFEMTETWFQFVEVYHISRKKQIALSRKCV